MKSTIISFVLILGCLMSASAQHPEIQVIYFQPTDVPAPDKADFQNITETFTEVQSFYRAQMRRHGYGPMTFAFECKIHWVKGTRPLAEYAEDQAVGMDRIETDFGRRLFMEFGERENIQVIFLAGAKFLAEKSLGVMFSGCEDKGCLYWSIITTQNPNVVSIILAHELGHIFGLVHREQQNLVMNPKIHDDGLPKSLKRYAITPVSAKTLSRHPFFHQLPEAEIPVKNPDLQLPVSLRGLKIRLWGGLKRVSLP